MGATLTGGCDLVGATLTGECELQRGVYGEISAGELGKSTSENVPHGSVQLTFALPSNVGLAVLGILFITFLVRDLSQQVRNGRRIHGDRFSGRTVDSGPISDHFWPDLKIRSGPNLARNPQPGAQKKVLEPAGLVVDDLAVL